MRSRERKSKASPSSRASSASCRPTAYRQQVCEPSSPAAALCLPPRLQAPARAPRRHLPGTLPLRARGEPQPLASRAWDGRGAALSPASLSACLRASALQGRRCSVSPLRPARRGGGAGARRCGRPGRQARAAPGLQAEPRQRGQPRRGRPPRELLGKSSWRAAAVCSLPGALAAAAAGPDQMSAGRRGCGFPGGSAVALPPQSMSPR